MSAQEVNNITRESIHVNSDFYDLNLFYNGYGDPFESGESAIPLNTHPVSHDELYEDPVSHIELNTATGSNDVFDDDDDNLYIYKLFKTK